MLYFNTGWWVIGRVAVELAACSFALSLLRLEHPKGCCLRRAVSRLYWVRGGDIGSGLLSTERVAGVSSTVSRSSDIADIAKGDKQETWEAAKHVLGLG